MPSYLFTHTPARAELVVGNMVRRVLFIIREEGEAFGASGWGGVQTRPWLIESTTRFYQSLIVQRTQQCSFNLKTLLLF